MWTGGGRSQSGQGQQGIANANDRLVEQAKAKLLDFVEDLIGLAKKAEPNASAPRTPWPGSVETSTPSADLITQPAHEATHEPDPKRVFVISGQNINAYNELCKFLRSLSLNPKSFFDVSNELRGGSPTVLEIVRHGMNQAASVVALFTADEWAHLRPELCGAQTAGEYRCRWQARPNVIFEAGLAMGVDADRTILVRGRCQPILVTWAAFMRYT